MVTCTDDCQHRPGLAACQPLTSRVRCAARATTCAGGGTGCLELVVGWEECEICLTCSAISNPNQSCIAWQATQIEKFWCLQGLRMDEWKRTQLCVLLSAAQEDTQICPLWNLREAWSRDCGVNTQTFAPVSFKVRTWGGGSVCVNVFSWCLHCLPCLSAFPSLDTAELSALARFIRTG